MRAVLVTSFALVAGAVCAGCAHEDVGRPPAAVCVEPVQHYEWTSAGAAEAGPARPRLAETRTLGADDPAFTDARLQEHAPVAAAPSAPAPVYVHHYYGGGYYGGGAVIGGRYGYAPSRTVEATGSRASSGGGTPPLGGNWASPPSYGPRFPFSTGPANPWR